MIWELSADDRANADTESMVLFIDNRGVGWDNVGWNGLLLHTKGACQCVCEGNVNGLMLKVYWGVSRRLLCVALISTHQSLWWDVVSLFMFKTVFRLKLRPWIVTVPKFNAKPCMHTTIIQPSDVKRKAFCEKRSEEQNPSSTHLIFVNFFFVFLDKVWVARRASANDTTRHKDTIRSAEDGSVDEVKHALKESRVFKSPFSGTHWGASPRCLSLV